MRNQAAPLIKVRNEMGMSCMACRKFRNPDIQLFHFRLSSSGSRSNSPIVKYT